jgi:HAMP domain-containing protein
VRADQDWCLECGAAARTRIARTPAWRIPVFLVALVIAFSGAAAAFAFVRLSNTDDDLRAAKTAASLTQPAAPPTTATGPAIAVPEATTPDTGTTTPRPSPFTQTSP